MHRLKKGFVSINIFIHYTLHLIGKTLAGLPHAYCWPVNLISLFSCHVCGGRNKCCLKLNQAAVAEPATLDPYHTE